MTEIKVSDRMWEMIKTALPEEHREVRAGRPPADNRKCFEGILWILSKDSPWADLPPRFGSPSCVNRRFLTWISSGVWTRMFDLFVQHLTDQDERLRWLGISERLRLPKANIKHRYTVRALPYAIQREEKRSNGEK